MTIATDVATDVSQNALRLHQGLVELRSALDADSDVMLAAWGPAVQRSEFQASARNLADYLALRKIDLREVQPQLTALGLSSLGRCEGHVRPSLDAVIAALAGMAGLPPEPVPPALAFVQGQSLLDARKERLFGPHPDGPVTRIMATLPTEAASDPALIRSLVAAGADCVRINCAHDSPEVWSAMIEHTHKASAEFGRDIRVAMDLGGPKVRLEQIAAEEKLRLKRGDHFALVHVLGDAKDPIPSATLSYPELIDHLVPGSEVWIDDGKIGARVLEKSCGRAVLEVTSARDKGVRLKPEKGVNLPGVDIQISALTAEDLKDLDFVMQHADIVGYSFVQTPQDVRDLIDAMQARNTRGRMPALILKIETQLAVRNLPRLIVQAGGALPVAVMIARGDLAVEIGLERMSEIQEEILWLCEAAQVPVVWATQVLDSLLKEGHASRAETTDAAMGQRAECVMLNKGAYLPEAVAFLGRILRRMERHQSKKSPRLGPLQSWREPQVL